MQCPSCGLQIDLQNLKWCPRCGRMLNYPAAQNTSGDSRQMVAVNRVNHSRQVAMEPRQRPKTPMACMVVLYHLPATASPRRRVIRWRQAIRNRAIRNPRLPHSQRVRAKGLDCGRHRAGGGGAGRMHGRHALRDPLAGARQESRGTPRRL